MFLLEKYTKTKNTQNRPFLNYSILAARRNFVCVKIRTVHYRRKADTFPLRCSIVASSIRLNYFLKLPTWHCAFFRLTQRSEKSGHYFLHNFANGGHCEIAIMTLRFFSSSLTVKKKSKLIFANFREWSPSRSCHHDTPLSFVMLNG